MSKAQTPPTPVRDGFKEKVKKHLKKHDIEGDADFVDHKHQKESLDEMKVTELKKKIAHFRAEKKKRGIKEGEVVSLDKARQ